MPPLLPLGTAFRMHLTGRLHPDAVMWPLLVVETDKFTDATIGLLIALVSTFPVYDLRLEDTVHTLSYGIVSRFVVFCHADAYLVFAEQVHIVITAVLYASVRVVNQMREFLCAGLVYGALQSVYGMFGFQSLR